MSEQVKNLLEQFIRFSGLLHRYQMNQYINRRPFGNPYRGQGRVLSILKMQSEISQKELLYLLDMSKQALGELLNKLERSGYITRTISKEDRRAVNIKLTPEGMEVAGNIDTEQLDADNLFDCLNDQEQENFRDYLERLAAELEKKFDDSEMYHSSFGGHMRGHHGSRMRTDDDGNDHHKVFGHGSHRDIDHHNEYHHGRRLHNDAHPDDKE
ncbi:MarR family winged helix-turn-helix transcriptional regulator [Lacrimispora sp. 38-1]|uniref:MarR family winged helix-turn-helix transcriptional regulator n=1 Tax=Lacrimispora sp. 38-1 TaxID=3125778 RepID=UPI003CF8F76C